MDNKSSDGDWCRGCGAWFPPEDKPGQGICLAWQECQKLYGNQSRNSGEVSKDSSVSADTTIVPPTSVA